ncbi:MAG: glycosyltransferase family 2 protein [Candidatus Omnitrophota bacterium]|jgi:glycosyltransferase involved in cell wall biosynthesis
MTLSAIVLTRNEERNIEDCLESLSWADELLVVDSGSTDLTVPLAEKCGARVVTHPFTDFATQRNFAMSLAKGNWILFIDADERVTPELAGEIKETTGQGSTCVYAIPRRNYFFGKRLRFGDSRKDAPIRLFPRHDVTWAQPVHEMIVTNLSIRRLKNPLLHYSTRNLTHYRRKIRDYVPLEIETLKTKGTRPSLLKAVFLPPAKFLQLYLLKLGVLDGIAGFQYAILSSYYIHRKHWLHWKAK